MKLVSIALLIMASSAMAEDSPWTSQAELGYIVTSGNTETSTLNAKMDVTHEREKWRHNIHAEVFGTSVDGKTSGERYQASAKTNHKYNEFDYSFVLLNYETDKFSGFDYQSALSVGYGRRLLNVNEMTFDFEIGPGVRILQPDVGESETEGFIRVASKYNWNISEHSNFSEELTSDVGVDMTVSKSITSLQANINSTLAMKITVTVKYTSDVPLDKEKKDTETAITIVYAF